MCNIHILVQCNYSTIILYYTIVTFLFTQFTLPHPVAVRLAGGSTEAEGRVEVYIIGEWGTVCGMSWDPLDSKVICQQLGYKGVNRAYSNTNQHNFGEGTGRSWLSDLRCTGSEANLLQCPHDGVGGVCAHLRDVGVVCTNEDLPGEGEHMHRHVGQGREI